MRKLLGRLVVSAGLLALAASNQGGCAWLEDVSDFLDDLSRDLEELADDLDDDDGGGFFFGFDDEDDD